jgi:hypothetical protein
MGRDAVLDFKSWLEHAAVLVTRIPPAFVKRYPDKQKFTQ